MQNVPKNTLDAITRALKAEGIYTPQVLAYALATIQHETAGTFEPIAEYGGRSQARKLRYSGGENFYGRGYIQLTHDYNYRDIGKRIGLGDKLVRNPDLALQPEVAAKILAAFFKDRGVADAAEKGDFYNARRPVNGLDRAGEIAKIAQTFLANSKDAPISPTPKVSAPFDISKIVPQVYAEEGESPTPGENDYTQVTKDFNRKYTKGYVMPSEQETVVKPGDTLYGIAQKTLGNGNRYGELKGYTGRPNALPVGTRIKTPTQASPTVRASMQQPNTSTRSGPVYTPPPVNRPYTPAPSYSAPKPVPVPTPRPASTPAPNYTSAVTKQPAYAPPPAPKPAAKPNLLQSVLGLFGIK